MTDDSLREQPDEQPDTTSASHALRRRSEQDNDDIVGRTRLPLLSLSGLDQTPFLPLLNKPAGRTTVPLPKNKGEEVAGSPVETPFVPASRAVHSNRGEAGALPYTARLAGPPPVNKKAPGQAIRVRRPGLLLFMLTLLFCLLISVMGAYLYIHASTTQHNNASLFGQTPPNNHPGNNITFPAGKGLVSQGNSFASVEGESFRVGGQPMLEIRGQKGNVNVATGNAGTIIVKASSKGQSADVINQNIHSNQSKDGQGHDVINIATAPGYAHVDYNIMVPASTQVKVEVDSGSISVDGVSGVNVDTTNGSLDIEDVSGAVNVDTTNGDITARNIKGQMTMETVNGSVRANTISGQLKAVTQNGDVVVREAALKGQSTLKTSYGSVTFNGAIDSPGTYTLGTHNGNVNLTLPGNAAFQLHASTGSGSIYNEFGRNIVGSIPQAQINVSIIGGGSIAVNKAT